MTTETLTKNIVSTLRKIAREDALKELEKRAIQNKDFLFLEKLQELKEETSSE